MNGQFATPAATSDNNFTTGYNEKRPHGEYFRSRRVKASEVERPWLKEKHSRAKWVEAFPVIGLALGLMVTGILIWDGVRTIARHNYCEVLNDNFMSWNSNVWTKEVEVGGFGYVSVDRVAFSG
jgi:hypothetical protein